MPVDTPLREYSAALPQWTRCRDCADGGDAVKARGMAYLPKLAGHTKKPEKYSEYKLRALFYNATGRTIEGLAGVVFQKAPKWDVDSIVEDQLEDVSASAGTVTADVFALTAMHELLTTGRYGVLVDYTDKIVGTAKPRPYWCGYRAEDIVSWRVEGNQLTMVVLRDDTLVPSEKDEFVLNEVEQYRVLRLVDGVYIQQVWQKADKKREWAVVETIAPSRREKPLDFIPFTFLGPTTTTPSIEKPPLLDMVDVNLSHYRSMADLEHGRHFTALPTPWVGGMSVDAESIEIGSGTVWVLSEQGRAGMLEFTGQGLGALERAEEGKRKMMATLGARLLEDAPAVAETATAVGIRHHGEHATLRTMVQSVEQGLSFVLKVHSYWQGVGLSPVDDKSNVELNKEFFNLKASPDEVKTALLAWQAGGISYETFYNRLQIGGWTREGVDAEQEQKDIETEDAKKSEPLDAGAGDQPPGEGGQYPPPQGSTTPTPPQGGDGGASQPPTPPAR